MFLEMNLNGISDMTCLLDLTTHFQGILNTLASFLAILATHL